MIVCVKLLSFCKLSFDTNWLIKLIQTNIIVYVSKEYQKCLFYFLFFLSNRADTCNCTNIFVSKQLLAYLTVRNNRFWILRSRKKKERKKEKKIFGYKNYIFLSFVKSSVFHMWHDLLPLTLSCVKSDTFNCAKWHNIYQSVKSLKMLKLMSWITFYTRNLVSKIRR